ncbi:30S ribosome-binding factor RbfA [Planctomicrobium sp. SH527]|uniref:30S ribosome-binding factor RbfA n=1 Tax=Planctomicrobium sp. SH527 TaxID=3448123 RepID=UPI003F5CB8A2
MSTRRTAKVAAAVRQVVSSAILFELRDPRVTGVTVLHVEVPPDLRTAKVFISILGDEKAARLTLMGLNAARGWIQSRIADVLDLRLTPVLTFVVDHGIKKSIEISKMLREVITPEDEADESEADESEIDELSEDAEDENPPEPQSGSAS